MFFTLMCLEFGCAGVCGYLSVAEWAIYSLTALVGGQVINIGVYYAINISMVVHEMYVRRCYSACIHY